MPPPRGCAGAKFFAKIHGTETVFVVRAAAPVYCVAVSFVYLQIRCTRNGPRNNPLCKS